MQTSAGTSARPPTGAVRSRTALGLAVVLIVAFFAALSPSPARAADQLLSQGRPATASSTESGSFPASAAVDGNTGTRWSSAFADPQWLQVDLGTVQQITRVSLNWEAAYATGYQIQTSTDATTWTTVYSTTTATGGTQNLTVTGSGRYVRLYGTARATQWGYSLWEFQVYGPGSTTPPDDFWGSTSDIPAANNAVEVKILNRTNGKYPDSQVYWSFNGQTHSIAEQPYLDMPANSAGRMYFYLGSPTSSYYDFIEFTVGGNVFNGNTTRVDAFGLKLAMRLHSKDGYDTEVGENRATFAEDRATTFQRFTDAVPTQFKVLAQTQAPYRIIAPGSDPSFRAGGANANYFTVVRPVGRRERGHLRHLRLRRLAGRQPRHVRRTQPPCGHAAGVAAVRPGAVLQGGARQLLRQVLARQRHQPACLRLPLRRRRGPVLVHLARRPAVAAGRRRLVGTTDTARNGAALVRKGGPASACSGGSYWTLIVKVDVVLRMSCALPLIRRLTKVAEPTAGP
jgi:hypothetical protein